MGQWLQGTYNSVINLLVLVIEEIFNLGQNNLPFYTSLIEIFAATFQWLDT